MAGAEQVQLTIDDGIALLALGAPEDKVVILNQKRMTSLSEALHELAAKAAGLRGLIIYGPHLKNFCAGADISLIASVTDQQEGRRLAIYGQELFSRLEALPLVKIAAISGACVGGGCEMALACNYRIAASSPDTRIGLPEIKLGIIPGFGGTQRLTRLIGLPRALDIILQGRVVQAKRALSLGLVDKLVSIDSDKGTTADLIAAAKRIINGEDRISRRPLPFVERMLTNNSIARGFALRSARKQVAAETRGNYPAPNHAIDAVEIGMRSGADAGYRREAEAIGQLAVSDVSKALVHIYFLTEASAKLGRAAKEEISSKPILIIGGGIMGTGIAASYLQRGFPVTVVEPIETVRSKTGDSLKRILEKNRSLDSDARARALERFTILSALPEKISADLVIEAVIEDRTIKNKVLSDVEAKASTTALIASNTSSISISELAGGLKSPSRFIGMHFFNPAEKMPLVEIIRGQGTDQKSIVKTAAFTSALSKYPVVVGDCAGFLVNRVLCPYLIEAGWLAAEGVSIDAIDNAGRRFGFPMGPLRLLDEIGLDTAVKVTKILEDAYGERMKAPPFLATLVEKGFLGKKNGRGFYRIAGKDETVSPEAYEAAGINAARLDAAADLLEDRLVLPMINEAVRAYDEGIAGTPGEEAAGQIDLAMVMGIGFPPFRGGLFWYIQKRGIGKIHDRMVELSNSIGPRFSPCEGIKSRRNDAQPFFL